MVEAVIFDLDGTLLDTIEDLANACNYALSTLGYEVHDVDKYKKFVGSGRYKLIERILPEGEKNQEIINKTLTLFDKYYGKHMVDMTKPYEGITNLINSLIDKGIKLAVVSNKPHEFTTEVVKKYFGNSFEIVYGQREGYPVKPDPKTVFEVVDNLEVDLKNCIYVGDSDVDIKTAKNAGVKSIGVAWGFRGLGELEQAGADYIVASAAELEEVILNSNPI
jgi:phosphoglycolate phosphatase